MPASVKTAIPFHPVRWAPVGIDESVGRMLEESGVVDYIACADLADLSGFIPPQVRAPDWKSRPDSGSWYDSAVSLAVSGTRHPGLGLIYGGVSVIRNGPVELFRKAMALTDLMHGNTIVFPCIGERYNLVPFGWKRSEGLARFEDHMRLYQLLWERDEPFDYEGKVWNYKNAFIGSERKHRPKFWAEGAGPKFLDIATKYADGWVVAVPTSAATPEIFAKKVRHVRELVEKAGRDPDEFGICAFPVCMIHENREVIDQAMQNPSIRILSALYGRLPHSEWEKEGVGAVFPEGWDYSLHWDAATLSDTDFKDLLDRIPEKMGATAFMTGSAREVGTEIQAYVDAGATMVHATDMLGARTYNWGETDEDITPWTPEGLQWRLEIFRMLKRKAS